jgi:hypothetical protein
MSAEWLTPCAFRFPDPAGAQQSGGDRYFEDPASLYLHKIVQT